MVQRVSGVKASVGFVSKYQKGNNVPTGETEFQFQVAKFNFHSTSYDWLVVAGAKAQLPASRLISDEAARRNWRALFPEPAAGTTTETTRRERPKLVVVAVSVGPAPLSV